MHADKLPPSAKFSTRKIGESAHFSEIRAPRSFVPPQSRSSSREFPGSVWGFLQGAEGDVNSGCVHKPEPESLLALDVFAGRFFNAVRRVCDELAAALLKLDGELFG